jgi:hypothetical protein
MHGKLHTARTHGRFYPGWRLHFATLVGLEQRFSELLVSEINAGLRTLLSRSRKTAYPDPNNSKLLTLPLSASILRNLPVAQYMLCDTTFGLFNLTLAAGGGGVRIIWTQSRAAAHLSPSTSSMRKAHSSSSRSSQDDIAFAF